MTGHKEWLLVIPALLLAASVAAAETMSVQVKTSQVRNQPSFLAKVVAEVAYGDRVVVLGRQGIWTRVRSPKGRVGWLHSSALTEKKIVMAAGKNNVETAASSDELALAGKGFNSDVEAEFKSRNKDIDFTWVDRMEKIIIDPRQMQGFLKQGEVNPPAGGGI